MNTIVITGRRPVDCPGFFHFGPLRTALVEARRVVLVHSWTYDANKDLKRFLYRQNKRVLDTLSIEHFLSFTDVTHAVTFNVELDPGQQRKYNCALQLKWKSNILWEFEYGLEKKWGGPLVEAWLREVHGREPNTDTKELWKRWDHVHKLNTRLYSRCFGAADKVSIKRSIGFQPIPYSVENLLSRSPPPSCYA